MFSGCTVPPDIVRRPNFEVATKRLLHQQVKYWGSFSAMFAHGSASLQLFPVVWIFLRSLSVICYDRWVLSEGNKNYFKDWCLMIALLDLFISSDAYNGFLSTGKFWSCYCLSFYWLSIIFTRGGPVSSHYLRLFSCWLGRSSWSFEIYSTGRYL